MTSALIRWHEAFQIFEPEIMLEDLDWEDTWQIPSSVRWRRMADNASFGWLLTWPALDVAISRFPFDRNKEPVAHRMGDPAISTARHPGPGLSRAERAVSG